MCFALQRRIAAITRRDGRLFTKSLNRRQRKPFKQGYSFSLLRIMHHTKRYSGLLAVKKKKKAQKKRNERKRRIVSYALELTSLIPRLTAHLFGYFD